MLAKVTRAFVDLEADVLRNEGEQFEVTPERFSAINATKYGQLAVEVEEAPSEEPTAPQTRRRTRKKAEE